MSGFITFAILTLESLIGLQKDPSIFDTYLESQAKVVTELPGKGYSFGPYPSDPGHLSFQQATYYI